MVRPELPLLTVIAALVFGPYRRVRHAHQIMLPIADFAALSANGEFSYAWMDIPLCNRKDRGNYLSIYRTAAAIIVILLAGLSVGIPKLVQRDDSRNNRNVRLCSGDSVCTRAGTPFMDIV